MTKAFGFAGFGCLHRGSCLLVSPNFGEDQMQFLCFKPERSSLRLQFRDCPNDHPKKMLAFARFLPASSDAFQKFLFGNCVVRFDVISANTSAGSHELSVNSIGYLILWNRLRQIGPFVLPNRKRVLSLVLRGQIPRHRPETSPRRAHFDLPISSFLRHSSFVIRASSFLSGRIVQFRIQPCLGKDPVASNRHG